MKLEYKSMFFGIVLGAVNVSVILLLLGDVETESFLPVDHNKQEKNIEVSIERTIENGEDLTNVLIRGKGDITIEELEEELDRMLEKQGMDKEKTKLNIEIEIQS